MPEQPDSAIEISKATRLVEYLTRVAQLRTKLIRDVGDYAHQYWVGEIPKQEGCFTRAWGPSEEFDPDVWIEVQNQQEPELPRVPAQCEEWVERSALLDTGNLPTLQTEITRQIETSTRQMDSDQREFTSCVDSIVDHPDVQTEWDKYVEARWLPWAEKHTAWETAHKTYAALFAIHQEQLRLGEEYELVLGIGLLRWQTPKGHRVRRHFLVANAVLEFEARLGKFTVRPAPDGACLRPELDMLDIEDQPARAEETAKLSLADTLDSPWETTCIEGVLQALVHSISSQGEYQGDLTTSKAVTEKPVVDFAPALILRKRSTRGLTEALKRIRHRIELGEDIPSEFRDLAEIQVVNDKERETEPSHSTTSLTSEVFFPKPFNDEQRCIIEVMRASNGVLVQGPPGTGKSHTIANLICHLLATGQRTLVTAKTPRALQVLQQLIPEELRPLCINLLGSGLEEKRSLEASVAGVLRKHERWSDKWAEGERSRLHDDLRRLREEKAVIDRRLRDIREAETHSHSLGSGTYCGTAARIAEAVNRDRETYKWCANSGKLDESCPLSAVELRKLLVRLRKFTPDKRRELSSPFPTEVPSVQSFTKLVEDEEKSIKDEQRLAISADEQLAEELSRFEASRIDSVHGAFSAFRDALRRQSASPHQWLKLAVSEILGGSTEFWRELLRVTAECLLAIEPGVSDADDTQVTIKVTDDNVHSTLSDVDARLLYDDASRLKAHLEQGGKLGWWILRPDVVKERLYLCNNVKVNGHTCNSIHQLSQLVDLLDVHLASDNAWKFWACHVEKPDGPYSLQFSTLKSLRSALDDALAMEELVDECRDSLRSSVGLAEPKWLDEAEIDRIIASSQLARVRQARRLAVAGLKEIEERAASIATRCDAHPAIQDFLKAIHARDVSLFSRANEDLQRLTEQCAQLRQLDDDLQEFRQTMRAFAEHFIETCSDPVWDVRVESIQEAWNWDRAKYWVEEHTRKEDAPSLARRSRQIDDEVNEVIAELASCHAWSYCFSRLTENHRRHMEAWQQSMRKLGKGTGKHAPSHRREAQQHLNECRNAVPAWVMPLHRVWDTVDPAPGMFDVVIIDEASQCGVEALPLLYLAKKVLVVGDDKQISPDAVGLPLEAVHRLMEEYLHDFRFKTVFGVESSLFDHGKLRYGTRRITLREHFRCMPEIIRFSNELCYSDTPLIPLRQYGPSGLDPLKHRFIEKGYREGRGNRVVNRPEAESLVTKIVELCQDPRYNDKTMGVVVLQGEAQARVIEDLLLEQLGVEEIERRRLICGNSYSFQGDERDVMFLSMVAAPNERIGPLVRSADERRLNVAASRARDQLWLFHSVRSEDLSTSCLRRRLLEHFLETKPQQIGGIDREDLERTASSVNRTVVRPPTPFDSWFEVDVALQLVRRGFTVVPQHETGGKRIDLVVEGGLARLAVECDGDRWHGADQYEADMQRQRMLERCGWEFFRVRESAFYSNRDESLQQLWVLLVERGILAKGSGVAFDVRDAEEHAEADSICEEMAQTVGV